MYAFKVRICCTDKLFFMVFVDHFQELCEIWNTVNENFEQVGYTLDLKVVGEGKKDHLKFIFYPLKMMPAFTFLIHDHVGNSGTFPQKRDNYNDILGTVTCTKRESLQVCRRRILPQHYIKFANQFANA